MKDAQAAVMIRLIWLPKNEYLQKGMTSVSKRQIEARDLTEIAKWERGISKISFGEEAITDLAFQIHKLEKAMIRERPGMLVLDVVGCAVGWMWMSIFRHTGNIKRLLSGTESKLIL